MDQVLFKLLACRSGFAEALAAARQSDAAIVVVGETSMPLQGVGWIEEPEDYRNATSGEGYDRTNLNLTGVQEDLIKAVVETGTPVVVVLINGRPQTIPWIKENVPAILEAWYPGQEGGNAIADVLFGDANPGGKLPVCQGVVKVSSSPTVSSGNVRVRISVPVR